MNIDSVKINTSLIMMKEWLIKKLDLILPFYIDPGQLWKCNTQTFPHWPSWLGDPDLMIRFSFSLILKSKDLYSEGTLMEFFTPQWIGPYLELHPVFGKYPFCGSGGIPLLSLSDQLSFQILVFRGRGSRKLTTRLTLPAPRRPDVLLFGRITPCSSSKTKDSYRLNTLGRCTSGNVWT